ncbi:hypothetical protein DEJ13_02710 [Curtobacterium sp. MCLR17_007]|uniref:hypothetical protein n=1 Tax=Curtobacterium sp. MCLR17_007 TaxID=2175648 RepID=UPI0024DFD719|nr:hypothetical protein [Curtobacterium sp. MCLR17_007]WIB60760.1 hypothetical protein DEJ13_02710 [Curtobacterium sp. MCLR17_007]
MIVLVVVDVVLVALALSRTAPESNGSPGPVPTFTSTPGPDRTDRPAMSATPSATPAAGPDSADGDATAEARLLSAVDAKTAWRSTRTQCGGSTVVERTADGGVTWQAVDLESDVDAIYAIRAQAGSVSLLVGVGTDCTPAVRTTTDAGSSWKPGAVGDAGAGVTPAGIVLRSGMVASPCPQPREAFQGSYTATVVCADGVVQWRQGSGPWVAVPIAGVRSLADAGDSYTLARTGVAGCAGVSIDSLRATGVTTATKTTTLGCAARATASGPAVARTASATWLWSGDDVLVSTDGGATW